MQITVSESLLARFDKERVFFTPDGRARFQAGELLHADAAARIEPFSAVLAGNFLPSIGAFSYTWSLIPNGVVIGRYCSISWEVRFIDLNHPLDFVSTSSFTYDPNFVIFKRALGDVDLERYPIGYSRDNRNHLPVIEHDVWIGQNASLARGITIGIGAVVAAFSVVTKSVPPYAIVGGNPARIIRMRFEPPVIDALLASEWWKYPLWAFKDMPLNFPLAFTEALQQKVAAGGLEEYRPEPFRFRANG